MLIMERQGWPKIPMYEERKIVVKFVSTILNHLQVVLAVWLIIRAIQCSYLVRNIYSLDLGVVNTLLNRIRLKNRVYFVWSLILWVYIALLISTCSTIKPALRGTGEQLTDVLKKGLSKYYEDAPWSRSLERIQKKLLCCGVKKPQDWLTHSWNTDLKLLTSKEEAYRVGKDGVDKPMTVPNSCCNPKNQEPCVLEPIHTNIIGTVEKPSNIAFKQGCREKLTHQLSAYSRSYISNLTISIINLVLIWFLQRLLINSTKGRQSEDGIEYTWLFVPLSTWLIGRKIKTIDEDSFSSKSEQNYKQVNDKDPSKEQLLSDDNTDIEEIPLASTSGKNAISVSTYKSSPLILKREHSSHCSVKYDGMRYHKMKKLRCIKSETKNLLDSSCAMNDDQNATYYCETEDEEKIDEDRTTLFKKNPFEIKSSSQHSISSSRKEVKNTKKTVLELIKQFNTFYEGKKL